MDEQAAEKKEGKFDLVLSDIGLPDGTGLQLMKALKQKWGLKVSSIKVYDSLHGSAYT
jgi:CheY-like chemotaxis protein